MSLQLSILERHRRDARVAYARFLIQQAADFLSSSSSSSSSLSSSASSDDDSSSDEISSMSSAEFFDGLIDNALQQASAFHEDATIN